MNGVAGDAARPPNAPIRNPKSRIRNRRGAALILVLFAIAFISVLAVAMLQEATTDLAIHRNHVCGLKALYAANAGVEDAIAELRDEYDTTNTVNGTLTGPDGVTCTWSAEIDNDKPVVTVLSTGTAAGFTRKVEARLVVGQPPATSQPYPVRIVWWREIW
jgi:Tfp pilus assembly protein PilX